MLTENIKRLPFRIEQDDPNGGVLRPWVRQLPLRMQGVLLTAIRGCDISNKEDCSKGLSRMIRRATMNPADPRETTLARGFFGFDPVALTREIHQFLHSLDQYPLHYVMHLMHACEVIGYEHPEERFGAFFKDVYLNIVDTLHLQPETRMAMIIRLTEDRIEKGTVEDHIPFERIDH